MRRADHLADADAASIDPLLRLAQDAGSGEVSESVHRQGRERLQTALAVRAAPRTRRTWAIVAAAAAAMVIAAGLAVLRPSSRLGYTVEGGVAAEGGYVAPANGSPATARFTDGTTIAFDAGGRGRVAEVRDRGARVVIEAGAAHIHVAYRDGAVWSIEAGPFAIEVTGTVFDVRWSPAEEVLDVRMFEGSVIVKGPPAPDGIALRAGQRLRAHVAAGDLRVTAWPPPSAMPAPSGPEPGDLPANNGASAPAGAPSPPVAPSPPKAAASQLAPSSPAPVDADAGAPPLSWSQRVAAGDFAGVLSEAQTRGLDGTLGASPLADLAALADAARYSGRTDIARRALLAQRARFAGSPEARAAAFLLGRIADDAQGSPASAIAFYDAYLSEAPGGPFAAEALGRKMIALRKSSGPEAARVVAAEYLRRYPAGPHASVAKELASGP